MASRAKHGCALQSAFTAPKFSATTRDSVFALRSILQRRLQHLLEHQFASLTH
jgi:hypothetical protein